jgi:hypothetical protein
MILILFFVAFVILVYLFMTTRQTVIVYEEPAPVSWWSWPITSYNWWPYWGYYGSSGSYGGGLYGGRSHYRGPLRAPHQESRPWGGASRYANASAPLGGGHHGGPSGGPSGGHSGGGRSGGPSGGHSGGGHR